MKKTKFCVFLFTIFFLNACKKDILNNLAQGGINNKVNFRSELGGNRTNGYENFLEDSESTIHFKITTQYPFNSMHSTQASAYFLTNKWASYDTVQRNYLDVGQVSLNSIYLPKHEKNGYVLFSPTEVQSSQLVSLLGT